jgi:uncharacterized membrane protein YciS (DUF1049 family)
MKNFYKILCKIENSSPIIVIELLKAMRTPDGYFIPSQDATILFEQLDTPISDGEDFHYFAYTVDSESCGIDSKLVSELISSSMEIYQEGLFKLKRKIPSSGLDYRIHNLETQISEHLFRIKKLNEDLARAKKELLHRQLLILILGLCSGTFSILAFDTNVLLTLIFIIIFCISTIIYFVIFFDSELSKYVNEIKREIKIVHDRIDKCEKRLKRVI